MSDDMVEIVVDAHEEPSGLPSAIGARDLGVVVIRKLKTGDVALNYKGLHVGLEIKRKFDFDNSLTSGRLHDQIARLTESYDFPVLIIEGWNGEEEDIHIKQTRTLNGRITLIHTESQDDTVDYIADLVKHLEDGKLNVIRRKVIVEKDLDPQITLLCGFPFISKARAEDLLGIYGSPKKALENMSEWERIRGITVDRLDRVKLIYERETR